MATCILDDIAYVPEINEAQTINSDCVPERRLGLAIVLRAIEDMRNPVYTDSRHTKKTVQAQAKAWPQTADFRFICALAGLNPEYVRGKIA